MKYYLASKSPRRKELLKKIISDFVIYESNIEEKLDLNFDISCSIMSVAFQKADFIYKNINLIEPAIIISADTVVYLDEILQKPKNKDDARIMLKKLSGNTHFVYTGFCIINTEKNIKILDFEKTEVKFKNLSKLEIEQYIETKEPYDKAGGYAIQGIAAKFIEKINGDYYNVVGLPLCKLNKILMDM
ncbi:MAG: septum formation protein Maf [Clostridiales bacterium]|nr:MAG: septum formation protein Maf [Clostridiales bacterium]